MIQTIRPYWPEAVGIGLAIYFYYVGLFFLRKGFDYDVNKAKEELAVQLCALKLDFFYTDSTVKSQEELEEKTHWVIKNIDKINIFNLPFHWKRFLIHQYYSENEFVKDHCYMVNAAMISQAIFPSVFLPFLLILLLILLVYARIARRFKRSKI